MRFDEYWRQVDTELAGFPARPSLTPTPARSTADFTGFEVRLTGLASYRLFGYLSVPTGSGPFPALLETPRHGSVNHVPDYQDRMRYVVFTAMHRGQRLADSPFAASYPGLFTLGIDAPETFIYRGIVADCLRAAEFLFDRPEIDPQRVGISGDDLALLTAARRPGFAAIRVTGPLLHQPLTRRHGTDEYPLEELNDRLRHRPDDESALAETLSLFEPTRHATAIKARTLLATSDPSPWHESLLTALAPETYSRTDDEADDAVELDAWLARCLGVEPRSRFLDDAR
ncbi:acetylxylan esterase [Saccharopolyspora sp. K220]|uniref:acetylxylan esterase n=1 Tax=Saccharopolyspora soli TaxID=2926618 RepID=UPI001F57143B|nr:acetylxylan esterase [Saccharopolyspora soli]MCI2417322.1 acetylxylan esterase [Saccharopolyspora soli]